MHQNPNAIQAAPVPNSVSEVGSGTAGGGTSPVVPLNPVGTSTGGSPNGPLLVSTDGGATWVARNIIPSSAGDLNTFDVTIRFNSAGTVLYLGMLRDPTVNLEVARTTDMTFSTAMTVLEADKEGIAKQGAGEREALPLPCGKNCAGLADARFIARGESQDHLMDARSLCRGDDILRRCIGSETRDVLRDRAVEELDFLRQIANVAAEDLRRPKSQRGAIETNCAILAHHAGCFAGMLRGALTPSSR